MTLKGFLNMFDKEFYPTNNETLHLMEIDCLGKICYEPHAGKGDIVDYLYLNGAKEVIATEKNDDLRQILQGKCKVIGDDILKITPDDVSHIDLIVMNPPFSQTEKHILHAFEIAPEGCEIICLCNWETITSSAYKYKLKSLITNYGTKKNLGDCFRYAEKTTPIDIALVKLFKPIVSDNTKFEGFFMDEDEIEEQEDGIMKFDEVRAVVQMYVGAMKVFDKMKTELDSLKYIVSLLGFSGIELNYARNKNVTNKEDFGKCLQKAAWNHIINKMGLKKIATSGMMEDINRFVETQEKIPFTMKNIYHMMDMIFQTREQNLNKALIKTVDLFTKHTHENRFSVEGWKTNAGHMLNKKFIVENVVEIAWGGSYVKTKYDTYGINKLEDLNKILCFLKGENYDKIQDIRFYKNEGSSELVSGQWYDWGFFTFKAFKKGTMHLKFKNEVDWYDLNKKYSELKGFQLPEKLNPRKQKEKTAEVKPKKSKTSGKKAVLPLTDLYSLFAS